MGDLEDRVFKQNVPGRWSTLDDNCDTREDEESNHQESQVEPEEDEGNYKTEEDLLFEKAQQLSKADVPEPIRRKILAERMGKSKTGVKGVLEDYKTHQKLMDAHRNAEVAERQAILRRIAQGGKREPESITNENTINLNIEDEDDEDDAFLAEYRLRRLKELQQKSFLPQFGVCKDVDASAFVDEVDKADPRVVVIVHLYEPSIQSCIRVNRYLDEIAISHPNIKILRMKASTNEIEVDLVTLPILNFYRGGECFHVAAGLAHEFGEFFKKDDLEWIIDTTIQENIAL